VSGNFRFKVGVIDFSYEAAVVKSARFDLALRRSVESMAERMAQLEEILAQARFRRPAAELETPLGDYRAPIPAEEPYVDELAQDLSAIHEQSGHPPKDLDDFRAELKKPVETMVERGAPDNARQEPSMPAAQGSREDQASTRVTPDKEPATLGSEESGIHLRVGNGHENMVAAMEELLNVAEKLPYHWEKADDAPISATIARSQQTYEGICWLLGSGLSAQAAMLTYSLYEDVVVAHQLYSGKDSYDLLIENFRRHRQASAQSRAKIEQETGFSIPSGPAFLLDPTHSETGAGYRPSPIWWGAEREGSDLRTSAKELEGQAAGEALFSPRLVGGEEPLFSRLGDLIHDWFDQAAHPTAVGVPFAPSEEKATELTGNQTSLIGFTASWLFAQQIYLRFELDEKHHKVDAALYNEFNSAWLAFLDSFASVVLAPESAKRLLGQWNEYYGRQTPETRAGN